MILNLLVNARRHFFERFLDFLIFLICTPHFVKYKNRKGVNRVLIIIKISGIYTIPTSLYIFRSCEQKMTMLNFFIILVSFSIVLVQSAELLIDKNLLKRYQEKPAFLINRQGSTPLPAGIEIPYPYPLFSQCDSKWGSDLMDTKTVCQVGCLMSSTSMAIAGSNILIPPTPSNSNPGTMNTWLKSNGGYDGSNNFIEPVAEQISPSRIVWPSDAMHKTNDLPYSTIISYLQKGRIVIANVNEGHHFVLIVGYSVVDNDTFIVNDPGYTRDSYSYSKDVVGYRIFDMVK